MPVFDFQLTKILFDVKVHEKAHKNVYKKCKKTKNRKKLKVLGFKKNIFHVYDFQLRTLSQNILKSNPKD